MNIRNLLLTVLLVLGMSSNVLAADVESSIWIDLSAVNTNCAGDPHGSATVDASLGTEPYIYRWSNGGTTATITDLVDGRYTVTVTDATGAEKNGAIWVEASNRLRLTFNQRTIACARDENGKVVAVPQGGAAPFTYQWSDGSTQSALENIGQGVYKVTVTDANGCRIEARTVLEEPDPIRIKASHADVSCGEEADGYVSVTASGGDGNYTFFWDLDSLGGTRREGLKPGAYSVTVTDGNGCWTMICPEVEQSEPPTLSTTIVDETCPGEGDGRGYISVSGDSPPYVYAWPNEESKSTFAINLSPGTYPVTVTNARNCVSVIDVVVGQAGGGFGFVIETTGFTCGGGANGQAAVSMTGGVAPFNYEWVRKSDNTTISTAADVSTFTPGEYEVLVTDGNGCFGKRDVLFTAKDLPTITTTAINGQVCFDEKTGAASVSASGGEGPYTFEWFNGETGQTIENLPGGNHGVTVTDRNGCQATTTVAIIESSQIVITEQVKDLICHNTPEGAITVDVSGGSGTYTYDWSNGSTAASISNVLAGTYFVTLTDSDGCQAIKGINISEPPAIVLTTASTNAADLNTSDGSASVNVSGGTAPYTYAWNNGATTATIDNLPAGDYTVTVTDGNGCTETTTVTVAATCTLIAAISDIQNSEVCFGESTASASVTASGGDGNYTFKWFNGESGQTIDNLPAGNHRVTVTDGKGCEVVATVSIGEKPQINITEQVKDLLCHNTPEGAITLTVSGGSGDFSYAWSNGATTASIQDVLAGTYRVTVTDSDGCQVIHEITINEPPVLTLTTTSISATDLNTSDGSASVTAAGGTVPYTYAWSNGATTATINNIPNGSYTVTVTDGNGCTETTTVRVAATCTLIAAITDIQNSEVCFGESTASASVTASGGDGNYTFKWFNGESGQTIDNLPAGNHKVTVTDGKGCEVIAMVSIGEKPQINITEQVKYLLCHNIPEGAITLNVSGGSGNFSYAWSNGATTASIQDVLAGTYRVTVKDSDDCQVIQDITINEPPVLTLTTTSISATDLNTSDGRASVNAAGGTLPYTYAWSNGATTATINNIPNGSYTVTVTDGSGCTATETVIVDATCTLVAAITDTRAASCVGNDGTITMTVSGAKNGLTIEWSNGETGETLTGLVPGFYGVTVTDGTGCEYISSTFIADDCDCTQPVLEKALVFEANCGVSDGSLKIDMSGGKNNDFNYQWSDPAITGTGATGLPAGSYQVTITSKENAACSTVETINIGNTNVGPVLLLQSSPEICNGQKGSALLVPGNLTFDWSDGETGSFRNDLTAGTYLVTVTNPFLEGCKDFITVDIGLESGLSLTPVVNQRPDCGLSNGSVTINVAGGSGDYSYSWGAATYTNLPSGTFNVMVTDNVSGCTESVLFTLLENVGGVTVALDTISNVSCAGRMDGKINYRITESSDFNGPATVTITDGKGKEYSPTSLPVGNYCLIIKDANGCNAGEACFEITEPDFLLVNVTVIPKTCSVNNTILLTTSGGNGSYTYDWADQDGGINPRDRRNIENGTYSVIVTDEGGCSIAVDDVAINGECFICALEVTAIVDDAIPECGLPTGTATIEVGNSFGNVSYSWGADSVRTDLLSGDYTVTITDDFRGCDTTVSFTIPELEIPMEATIAELIVCQDDTGQLEYDLNNFRCFSQPVTATITDEDGTIYDENALPAFGNYIFIATDADGVELNRQFFSVRGYDSINVSATVVDEGCTTLGSIDLDLPRADASYTIQWEDLAQDTQAIDRTDLTEGTYTVTIIDQVAGSCSITRTYVVGKETGIAADLAPLALTCDIAPVQVTLEGEGLVTYEWSPANLVVSGQGTASPVLITDSNESIITVVAANAFGCSVEKEVKVVSVKTDLADNIRSTPQCNGLTIDFSSEGISSDYYFWDFGDGNTSDAVNPSHTYAEAGDYDVQLRLKPIVPCAEDRGALDSKQVSLVEEAQMTANFEIDYDACQDEGQISFKDLSTVNPGTITSWQWDFGNGMTSTEQNPTIILTEDANLNVSLEIESTIGCDDLKITEQSFKVFNIPSVTTALQICPGIPTALNPNPMGEATYEWGPAELLDNPLSANPIATTDKPVDFTVKITQGECVRNAIVQADVPKVQVFEQSEDEEVCDEEERLIFVNAPENSSIEWTDLNTGTIISTEAELMVKPSIYQVKLTDEHNCPVTAEVAIENFAIDAAIIDNTDPCEGGNGLLEIVNKGFEDITEYAWTDAEGIISATLNENSIEIEPAMTTDYTVNLKNNFGCELTLTETVAVSTLESMVIIPERDTIFKGEFTPINITPGGDYTVSWEASPTLQSMSGFEQVATPEETTTYTVTIIEDATGCEITQEVTVFVKTVECGEPNIFFPNAFTPNGDGQNDVLYVRGNALESVYFAVFNRWGEKVFESNSQEIGWDGTFEGKVVETDVYGYYLKVQCLAGEVYETQGNVTVLN